jgi:alpha-galactosidase
MIGAGSVGFTCRLLRDLLAVPELADTTFAMTDLSQHNLDMVATLCERDIKGNKLPAKVEKTTDRRRAVADADYIICTIRQGGLEAFQTDIDIPLKYGVDQCVGDTICAGGIMYAQRTIAALLDFCRDIREVAKPNALLLNYANPMAMNTWACNQYGGVKTIGLCHGVQGAHWQITQAIEAWAKTTGQLPLDYVTPGKTSKALWPEDFKFEFGLHRSEVDVICAGLNHQTWFTQVKFRGQDLTSKLPELMSAIPHFRKTEKVRLDVLNRFGYYSTESNGHLSEYLPWYRKRIGEIHQWIDLSHWIHGETGGYLRCTTEGRNWFETDFPQWLKEEPPKIHAGDRSEEHGSYIIESLETGRPYRGHFNVQNKGHITNLPDGCVIEIPGYVDGNGINMPVVGDLPLACAATCSASARVQQMGVEAAVHGDVTVLKQAMLHDPLVGAVCNPEEVWQMTDEMLVAQSRWLPQYAKQIEPARHRLEQAQRNGTRVKLVQTEGVARLHIKTVEEMALSREASRKNASSADKGNLTAASK